MSDIYIPGVKSKYDTDKMIADLMKVERIPRDRAEKDVEGLKTQKTTWQDMGRRMTALRDSARVLYSFQNPFNERVAHSTDEGVITASATREASEQERSFTVTQAAAADRFLSQPLEDSFRVDPGEYGFSIGSNTLSFTFRGGSLKEFVDVLNRYGKDKLHGDIVSVEQGKKSLLIESLITGDQNKLNFSKDAESLAIKTGMAERINDSRREVPAESGLGSSPLGPVNPSLVTAKDGVLNLAAGGASRVPLSPPVHSQGEMVFQFDASTLVRGGDQNIDPGPPPGPSIPPAGSVTYGGITIENDPSSVPIPPYTPPPKPPVVNDLALVSLTFSDGTSQTLSPLTDSSDYKTYQFKLTDVAPGKDIVAVDLVNKNTYRDVSFKNMRFFDPTARGGLQPRNPISTAQDAILSMDGIKIRRPSNTIGDLIPGVTLTLHGSSPSPVKVKIEPDRSAAKDAIIAVVGNYNRLLAQINVLTRNDDQIIQELTYLSKDEQDSMRKIMGTMQGDSTLNQFKSALQRIATATYPTDAGKDMILLSQIGVSTDARRAGSSQGYDASRLRGYLEIDEKTLETALQNKLPAIRQLFGNDTNGDLVIDSGFAYSVDALIKPYVEIGGIVALKTGTIDSSISQTQKRIDTLDKQLASKESDLKRQYGMMEGSLNRMEQASGSLDQFSKNSGQ